MLFFMNDEQRKTLTELVAQMRLRAQAVGSMHAWWQDIIEAEEFLRLETGASAEKAAELIAEFKRGHALHNSRDQGRADSAST